MKNVLLFAGGMATGVILLLIIASLRSKNGERTFFPQPIEYEMGLFGSKMPKNKDTTPFIFFSVIQVLNSGEALAAENTLIPTGKVVLLAFHKERPYYDGQRIDIPEHSVVKQVGTFKYKNNEGHEATVPIVDFFDDYEE